MHMYRYIALLTLNAWHACAGVEFEFPPPAQNNSRFFPLSPGVNVTAGSQQTIKWKTDWGKVPVSLWVYQLNEWELCPWTVGCNYTGRALFDNKTDPGSWLWNATPVISPGSEDPELPGAPTIFYFQLSSIRHPRDFGHSGYVAYGNGTEWHKHRAISLSSTPGITRAITSSLPPLSSVAISSVPLESMTLTSAITTTRGTTTVANDTADSTSGASTSGTATTVKAVLSSALGICFLLLAWAGFRRDRRGQRAIPTAARETYMSASRMLGAKAASGERMTVVGHKLWAPEILRKRWLFSMMLTFFTTAVVLGVLVILSHWNDGLCDADTRLHYLWTYAPTAFFTILAAIWSQILYRTKQMQPWVSLAVGHKEANDSVLLDYVSDWNPLVLFKALKRGHVVVASAVLASLIIQLVIVLSTGLFTVETVEKYSRRGSFQLTDRFLTDGSLFNPSQVDLRPAAITVGLSLDSLPLPPGTTIDMAFQQFSRPNSLGDDVLSTRATVDVLSSNMACEVAELLSGTDVRPPATATVLTDVNGRTGSVATFPTSEPSRTASPYLYGVRSPSCKNATISPFWPQATPRARSQEVSCAESSVSTKRWLLWVAALASLKNGHHIESAAVLCTPKYSVQSLLVELERQSHSTVLHANGSTASTIPNLDSWQLVDAFQNSVSNAIELIEFSSTYNGERLGEEVDETWLWLMAASSGQSLIDFLDIDTLNTTFRRSWATFSAQLFGTNFRRPINSTITGTFAANRDRLVMRDVSFWLIESCLILLCVLSWAVGWLWAVAVVPRDPSSVLSLATILSHSPEFRDFLQGTGTASRHQLEGISAASTFCTTLQERHVGAVPSFRIETKPRVVGTDYTQIWRDKLGSKNLDWHQPISSRIWFKTALPLSLVMVVVALEVLLSESSAHHGLAYVTGPGNYEHYYWTFLPALLMTALSWVVGMQYDTVKAFSPYAQLSRASRSVKATILRRPHSAFALWYSAKDMETYFVASGVAVLASTFLTIVVSGLLSSEQVPTINLASLKQRDWFVREPRNSPLSALGIALILNSNQSYPQLTYKDLVLSSIDGLGPYTIGKLNVAVPGVRPGLNCTLSPITTETNITIGPAKLIQNVLPADAVYTVYIPLKYARCTAGSTPNDNMEWKSDTLKILAPFNGYFGGMLWTGSYTMSNSNATTKCPATIGCFGRISGKNVIDLTVYTCDAYAHNMRANVTFFLPEMEIDTAKPVVVNNGTVEPWETWQGNAYYGDTTNGNPLLALSTNSTIVPSSSSDVYDGFMQTLIYGSHGIPATELAGSANAPTLLSASSELYGIAVAQILNNNRIRLNTSDAIAMQGTITSPGAHRLLQSALATNVLAGLLGLILVASTYASFAMKTRRILPKEPGSIVAVASLIADSDFLRLLQERHEWVSEGKLAEHFNGFTFSMGFWPGTEGEVGKRRFGIDSGRAEHLS